MTDRPNPPVPVAEPSEPTLPPEITLPYPAPRGEDPAPLEAGSLEHAAHLHASATTAPDWGTPGNVLDDRPHFLLIRDGQDPDDGVCGQDGETWPCAAFRKLTEQPTAVLIQDTSTGATMRYPGAVVGLEAAALAAGMTVEDFQLALARQRLP